MPHCLFTWNVITHSGNPTRYGCACQWPCHQKGHKTEQVCRLDKGNITSKGASRVSHLARFQSWWLVILFSLKYKISNSSLNGISCLYVCVCCVCQFHVVSQIDNCFQLTRKLTANIWFLVALMAKLHLCWTQILRTRGMRQARFSLIASLSKGSCFLVSLAIILRRRVWTNALTQKTVGFLLRTDNPANAKERLRQFCKMMCMQENHEFWQLNNGKLSKQDL